MQHRYLNVNLLLGTLVMAWNLAGCGVPLATATLQPSSVTATETPTLVSPSHTPEPTQPPTDTSTPETPIVNPTLAADEEQSLVLNLLTNSGECQLPCWWGFIPGETPLQDAQDFFLSIGKPLEKYRSGENSFIVRFNLANIDTRLTQYYIADSDVIEMIWVAAGVVRNDTAVFGDPEFRANFDSYLLPQVLTSFGEPTEVHILTFAGSPEGGWRPFHLLLFYPERGVLVDYQGPGTDTDGRIQWCPDQSNFALWLWPRTVKMSLEDIANMGPNFPADDLPLYVPLEQATGVNIQEFTQTFGNRANSACLETPANLWP